MGRRAAIDNHPQKKQIIRALVRGDRSFREIADQFGTNKTSLQRYLKEKLIPTAAKIQGERDLRDGGFLLDEINRVMKRVNLMYDACDEYLRDPNDPNKYFLGPRGDEIEVSLLEYDEDGKSFRTKRDLQAVFDKIDDTKGKAITDWHYKHADPRKLLLETARTLNEQLEHLAKITDRIKDVTVNIIGSPVLIEIQRIILQATKSYPKVRESLAEYFSSISDIPNSRSN